MRLNELTTPFERRRVIEYGADGNKVVRHWYEMRHVIGPLYMSRITKKRIRVGYVYALCFLSWRTQRLYVLGRYMAP